MAIQNPTKYVTVQRLSRFRQKIKSDIQDTMVASDALCESAADEIQFETSQI